MFNQQVNKSIIKTLSYSDVFDFPLTKNEIYKYYIGKKIDENNLHKALNALVKNKVISKKSKYYFLNGRGKNYSLRIKREKESKRKLLIAKKTAKILSFIPTIKLIGVSGSLSMNNCERRDDIDLFFITSKSTLWMTRFFVNIFLVFMGNKRSRLDNFGVDRVCPNMFLSEDNLLIDNNLFTAHEVAQLKILFNRENAHQRFLGVNSWILKHLPHSSNKYEGSSTKVNKLVLLIDRLFYFAQSIYMKKNMTIEKVTIDRAAFHPKDKTDFVIELYKKRYKNHKNMLLFTNLDQPQKAFELASKLTPGY